MTDDSRAQGGLICVAVVILGALFLSGLLAESYWAIALPVAAVVGLVLGLAFWVGWTIATVRVEPEAPIAGPVDGDDPGDSASSATQA
jgi:hypothetical protein